jgi:hypothetical protein
MIRHHALLAVFGLIYSVYSGYIVAQHMNAMDANMGSVPMHMGHDMMQNSPFVSPGTVPDMMQNSPFVSSGILPNHNPSPPASIPGSGNPGSTPGRPLVVLPVPASGMPGINTPYGYQFPGSYMPSGTPLHRYNGYTVCDPPDLSKGTTTGAATGATARRIVKSTSTRSPSAPGYPQPCPVYTIDGEIQQPKGYTTTTTSSVPNAAGGRQ